MTNQSAIKQKFSTTGTNKQQQCTNLHFIAGGKKIIKLNTGIRPFKQYLGYGNTGCRVLKWGVYN
jgi:hypothetical protein